MIKTYKKFKSYKAGDYILLIQDPNNKWRVDLRCKILKKAIEQGELNFYVSTYMLHNNEPYSFWVILDEIERKMTKSEIEEYELEKDAKKYNI